MNMKTGLMNAHASKPRVTTRAKWNDWLKPSRRDRAVRAYLNDYSTKERFNMWLDYKLHNMNLFGVCITIRRKYIWITTKTKNIEITIETRNK